MKLVIELLDTFKEHFDSDKLRDSFMRICGDIKAKGNLSGSYEHELADELKKAFSKADELKEK